MDKIDIRRYNVTGIGSNLSINNIPWSANGYQYSFAYDKNLEYPDKRNLFFYNKKILNELIEIDIDSPYLISKENEGNYWKLTFKNVNNNGETINYYYIEFILAFNDEENEIYVASYYFSSSLKNRSFKYNLSFNNIKNNPISFDFVEYDRDIYSIDTQEQANLKTSDLISYDVARTKLTLHKLKNIISISAITSYITKDNIIIAPYNDNKNLLFTFKAIGALSTDVTNIYIVKKNKYRQGLLYQNNNFISLPKLKKHFYIGSKLIEDDYIIESNQDNKGNVRIFNNGWKQAKYVEVDNK
nr:MAG TPA: hypothetical protein [Caudoviricetes sp.]